MDTIPLLVCFLGVGGVLIWFLREAHSLFEGEPLDEAKRARLKKAREPYMGLMLPLILAGSVTSAFWPENTGTAVLAIFVLMFLVFYYFAIRDIRKAVRST